MTWVAVGAVAVGGVGSYLGGKAQAGAQEANTTATQQMTQAQLDEQIREYNENSKTSKEEYGVQMGLTGKQLDDAYSEFQQNLQLQKDSLTQAGVEFDTNTGVAQATTAAQLRETQAQTKASTQLTVDQYNALQAAKGQQQQTLQGLNTESEGVNPYAGNYTNPYQAGISSTVNDYLTGALSPAQQEQMKRDLATGVQTMDSQAATMGLPSGGRAALTNQLNASLSQQYASLADENRKTGLSAAMNLGQQGQTQSNVVSQQTVADFLNSQNLQNQKTTAIANATPTGFINNTYSPTAYQPYVGPSAVPAQSTTPARQSASDYIASQINNPALTPPTTPGQTLAWNGTAWVPKVGGGSYDIYGNYTPA